MLAVLQFDAASLPVVERMLDAGRLPALAELRRRGLWRALDSSTDLFEAAAYPTVYSGVDVAEHGLFYPFCWSAERQRLHYMDRFPKPATVWERLGAAGRRALVVDPYQLWVTPETPGFCVSGWAYRHPIIPQWAAPRRTWRRAVRHFGRPPRLSDAAGPRSPAMHLRMRDVLTAGPGRTAALAVELLRERFDLVWITFGDAHQAGHHFWDLSQLRGDLGDGDRQRLETALEDVYVAVDAALHRILAALPEHADVLVFSPLGMGVNTTRSDLLPDMLRAVLRGGRVQSGEAGAGSAIWRVRAAVPQRMRAAVGSAFPTPVVHELVSRLYLHGVEWRRTRAFVLPGDHFGYIRLNVRGRERDGIVTDPDALMDEVADGLLTFRDADGGPAIAAVHRVNDELAGGAVDRLPDLVVRWSDRPSTRLPGVGSPRFGDVIRHGAGSGRSGNHAPGAWLLTVPASSRLRQPERPPTLVDVAATACDLLGADSRGLAGESLLKAS